MTDRIAPLRASFKEADALLEAADKAQDTAAAHAVGPEVMERAKALRKAMTEVLSERVEYQMSFKRDPSRRIDAEGLHGAGIDCAYGSGLDANGSWDDPEFWERIESEDGAIREALKVAVAEAVHEVLEWFRVDGEPYLDPHDSEFAEHIVSACYELGERLHDTGRVVRRMKALAMEDEPDMVQAIPA